MGDKTVIKKNTYHEYYTTLPSFPSLSLSSTTIIPKMCFVSPRPSMPAPPNFFNLKAKTP